MDDGAWLARQLGVGDNAALISHAVRGDASALVPARALRPDLVRVG
jgi:hypothetical protein